MTEPARRAPLQVCEARDCFSTGKLDYDNILRATITNFRLLTQSDSWFTVRVYEAAAGAFFWWFFALPTFAQYYVGLLTMAVLLKNYTLLSRSAPCLAPKREGGRGGGTVSEGGGMPPWCTQRCCGRLCGSERVGADVSSGALGRCQHRSCVSSRRVQVA